MRDFVHDYESLLRGFARSRDTARSLESPNPEDDEFVRMAIVGFSMNAKTESWSPEHYAFVSKQREDDFSVEALGVLHGEQAQNYALFAGLCLGFLLGLFQTEQVSEEEFSVGEAQLPGFMAGAVGALP